MNGFRWGRSEILLAVSIVVAWSVHAFWVSSVLPAPASSHPVSWQEQGSQAQQGIRKVFKGGDDTVRKRMEGDPVLWWRVEIALFALACLTVGALIQWGRFLLSWFSGRSPEPVMGVPPPPAWGGRQVLRLALSIFLAIQCFALLQDLFSRWVHPAGLDRHVAALMETLWVDLLAASGVCWFLSRAGRRSAAPSDLKTAGVLDSVRLAGRAYLFCLPLFVLLVLVVGGVVNAFHWKPSPQPVFTLYLSEGRRVVVRTLLLLAVVIGPLAEELFFRGFLYRWLRIRIGVRRALALSALLFALLHMDAVAFVPILGLGLLFGWVYEQTGSLAAPIAIHVFHNAGMLYLASLVKTLSQ